MEFRTTKKEYYSFSPDDILINRKKSAYDLIDEKNFKKILKLLYKILGQVDTYLSKEKISIGLKRSIINEIFINSSIFFMIKIYSNNKIKNKVTKIQMTKTNKYVLEYLKKNVTKNITFNFVKKKIKYSRLQILKQINFNEINYYLKKKANTKTQKNNYTNIIYKECPLLINEKFNNLNDTLFIRDKIKPKQIKSKINNNKNFFQKKKILKIFTPLFKNYNDGAIIKKFIENIIDNSLKSYNYYYLYFDRFLKNYNFTSNLKFFTSQLSNTQDFALMDVFKKKYYSDIIVYQHGHGQGLTRYHETIKFLKESSYSDQNIVFSNNAKDYDKLNNIYSKSKTIVAKYYQPYNKLFSQLNYFQKNYDLIYFSPFHMNGTDRSLYNYCINDLEKIKIEKKLIEKSLSKQKMKILIKKYPYDYQKYINENYIKNLTQKYNNIDYYDKTLKYPEFFKKNQIILTIGCGSTFGYLAAFKNPIILINLKDHFPLNEKVKKKLKKAIFLLEYNKKNISDKLNMLLKNKSNLFYQWEKKENYRKHFYKQYLGI